MGWPAGGFLPRVLYVAHHAGVACAIGRGCCDRGPPTRRLILDGLSSVATAQGLPNFRAVRICMHDAHCNECSLAFGVFSTHGPGRTCVERPFPFITMLSVDATAASYSSNASTPAPLAGVVSSRAAAMARLRPPPTHAPTPPPLQQRCGWIGGITDWHPRTWRGSHPPGLMANGRCARSRCRSASSDLTVVHPLLTVVHPLPRQHARAAHQRLALDRERRAPRRPRHRGATGLAPAARRAPRRPLGRLAPAPAHAPPHGGVTVPSRRPSSPRASRRAASARARCLSPPRWCFAFLAPPLTLSALGAHTTRRPSASRCSSARRATPSTARCTA